MNRISSFARRHAASARAAVIAAALLSAPLSGQRAQRYTLEGDDVAIWNLVGVIRVEGSRERGSTEVEVTRRGADADQLKVETGRLRGRETLRVVYPAEQIIFEGNRRNNRRWFGESRITVDMNEDGTWGTSEGRRGERVEIRSSGRGLEASAELLVRVPRGQRVTIHLAAGDATVSNVDGDIGLDVGAVDVTTTNTRGALSLDTGSGEVSVSDAEGELNLDSGSGSVTLARINGPSVTIDAGSGSLRGSDITADEINLDSGSGGVTLRGVKSREIQLDAGSGSVELQLLSDVDALTIDAGSGGVTVQIPESLGAMVTAESGSGGIDFDVPITVTRQSRRYLAGQLGDGRGRITVETGSGSVRFQRSTR